jgi:hypothetical protein
MYQIHEIQEAELNTVQTLLINEDIDIAEAIDFISKLDLGLSNTEWEHIILDILNKDHDNPTELFVDVMEYIKNQIKSIV